MFECCRKFGLNCFIMISMWWCFMGMLKVIMLIFVILLFFILKNGILLRLKVKVRLGFDVRLYGNYDEFYIMFCGVFLGFIIYGVGSSMLV